MRGKSGKIGIFFTETYTDMFYSNRHTLWKVQLAFSVKTAYKDKKSHSTLSVRTHTHAPVEVDRRAALGTLVAGIVRESRVQICLR